MRVLGKEQEELALVIRLREATGTAQQLWSLSDHTSHVLSGAQLILIEEIAPLRSGIQKGSQ